MSNPVAKLHFQNLHFNQFYPWIYVWCSQNFWFFHSFSIWYSCSKCDVRASEKGKKGNKTKQTKKRENSTKALSTKTASLIHQKNIQMYLHLIVMHMLNFIFYTILFLYMKLNSRRNSEENTWYVSNKVHCNAGWRQQCLMIYHVRFFFPEKKIAFKKIEIAKIYILLHVFCITFLFSNKAYQWAISCCLHEREW